MVGAVGVGLGTIFIAYPVLQTILKYAGVAYLIYLAAAIAMSEPVKPDQANSRGPMTFWGAAMFQWVNAKGWVMVIGTITAYATIAAYPWNIAPVRASGALPADQSLAYSFHSMSSGSASITSLSASFPNTSACSL